MKALLQQLWRRPPLRPCPAPEVLELPLLPSSRLRIAARLLLLMILLYAVELWLTGHRVAAPAVLCAVAGGIRWHTSAGESTRWLVLAADGGLWLRRHDDTFEEVQLGPTSLRLGAHLLLELQGTRRTFRVLLGPDNLAPELLAALKRRLPEPGTAGTALHSAPATGSDPRPT